MQFCKAENDLARKRSAGVMKPGESTVDMVRIATRDNMLKCFCLKTERARRRIRRRPENQKETICEGSSWLAECCLGTYS